MIRLILTLAKSISDKKRCRKRRRERCCPTTSPSPPVPIITPGVDLKNLCIKKNTKYLVYKAILDKEVFIAFDDLEGDSVEVFRWLISQGKVDRLILLGVEKYIYIYIDYYTVYIAK